MPVKVVVPQLVYRLEGVKINYDLTPQQAVEELLPSSYSAIARWPEDLMHLWNGGKTGVVEDAALSILRLNQPFSTAECRQKLEAGIGFSWPVEIASLAMPENEPQKIRQMLNELGIWYLVSLRQRDQELWRVDGHFRPFCLDLGPRYFGFYLGYASDGWRDVDALVGAPQVSLGA